LKCILLIVVYRVCLVNKDSQISRSQQDQVWWKTLWETYFTNHLWQFTVFTTWVQLWKKLSLLDFEVKRSKCEVIARSSVVSWHIYYKLLVGISPNLYCMCICELRWTFHAKA